MYGIYCPYVIRNCTSPINAPYLSPLPSPRKKKLHYLCFSFLLGITAVSEENYIKNNAYGK